jgi:hypothetical protein
MIHLLLPFGESHLSLYTQKPKGTKRMFESFLRAHATLADLQPKKQKAATVASSKQEAAVAVL